jgi:Methyltransferase domain
MGMMRWREFIAMKQIGLRLLRLYAIGAAFPFRFMAPKIPNSPNISHAKWPAYLSNKFNKPGCRILEVGSRVVTGANHRNLFDKADYIGFDFYAGPNVDVVGDAHRLSTYFVDQEPFDLIFSSAVFEHLYMPWTVTVEIEKLLKVGGHVFIETHFSFRSHERQWNFFQFSDMGLRVLFNDALGFELIESGMSNPIAAYFSPLADRQLRYEPISELYCHSQIFCKKVRNVHDFKWENLTANDVVGKSVYPFPRT